MSGSSTSNGSSTTTGAFHVTDGRIIGPNGAPFVARGIAAIQGNQPSASTLLSDFPGINFVRLAIYDYASPGALADYVNSLTSKGIVVELEDHNNGARNAGGNEGKIFTGSTLTNELNWYSSIASAFKDNPNVWFGTNNEPSEINASGNSDPAALSAWQQQTVQAVRNAGNNNPVMVEMNSFGPGKTGTGYTQGSCSGLQNIVWDVHYYGWLSGYSTSQSTVSNTLSNIVSDAQKLTSADGTVPVLIGECGNNATGAAIDANGTQVVTAVLQSGLSSAAWAWGNGGPGDGLSDGGTGLSDYGRQVAAGIAAAAAASPQTPASVSSSTPASAGKASANDTVITGTNASLTDASGNVWSITTGGQVAVNGIADATTAKVVELAYVDGKIWQETSNQLWWGETQPNAAWSHDVGTRTSPLPATSAAAPTPASAPSSASANNTVVTGTSAAITDASGNTWTITGTAQVAVNGVTDTTTANVTELAFINNVVWQENASNLWWGKASPTTAWAPGPGTSVSPLSSAVTIPATQTSATVSANQVAVTLAPGDHMVFVSGTDDTVNLGDGTNTVADTGKGNTYIVPAAGKGSSMFTSNVLNSGDKLDLRSALAATDWKGTNSTLDKYLSVKNDSQGAVLSISRTWGGAGEAIAKITGANHDDLSTVLAHSITR